MSTKDSGNSSDSDNLCVVCFKNVEIYSIGCCDHAVCFECSTRMRILCKQNECPICRQELPKVLFTKEVESFSIMFPKFERSSLQDRKVGIIFCTLEIQKAYLKLLEHRCHVCEESERSWPFKSFQQLKDHMRREHELFFCDICSDNLKIFSFERKCYTRSELGYHRRKGDKNNTSHRGHPICEFCDTRFMDNDELFRHLRRNHLFCHLCDADGKHQYYNSMDDLKRHFRDEHFLCEEGECKTMPLTAVFRTEIDLKAHITVDHSRFMSKSATRQARTLELEFTMAPRPRSDNLRNRRLNDRRDRFEEEGSYSVEPGGAGGGFSNQPQVFVNPLTSDHFPALGGNTSNNSNNISLMSKNYTKFSKAFNNNDFPSLGGGSSSRPGSAVTITASSAGPSAPEVTITRTVRNQPAAQKQKENFPALGGSSKPSGSSTVRLSVNSNNQQQTPKVSIQVNQKSNGAITTHITTSTPSTSQRTEVFPALGKANQTKPVPQAQWLRVKPLERVSVAPSPALETTDLESFPSLSKGKSEQPKKTSSVTVPVDSWVNLNTMKSNSKYNRRNENNNNNNKAESYSGKPLENTNKGSGDGSSSNKKGEYNKKSGNKPTPTLNNVQQSSSRLDAKLDELKLVEVKRSDDKNPVEDIKKTKKKKNKNSVDTTSNNPVTASNNLDTDNKNSKADTVSSGKEAKPINQDDNKRIQNGITKKRSELKIGTLSANTNPEVEDDEFPTLGSTKPPPGFSTKPALPQNAVKPPPGFNNSNFPSLSLSNDLTFTSSSGQSYVISPTTVEPTYQQPHNFQNRNQNLIRKFMDVLNDNESIKEFKTLSDSFRKGDVDSKNYHQQCRKILGNKFDDIFPELLVLLPDIEKQQELYKEIGGKCKESVVACEKCQQVIYKRELTEHYNHHRLENNFPTLLSAQRVHSAWKK